MYANQWTSDRASVYVNSSLSETLTFLHFMLRVLEQGDEKTQDVEWEPPLSD